MINKKFLHQKSKVFIGHSFSGLFCLYAALKHEHLFDQYFAVSPSAWANDRELLKIEKKFVDAHDDFEASIHIPVILYLLNPTKLLIVQCSPPFLGATVSARL